jgi:hypothetical protein
MNKSICTLVLRIVVLSAVLSFISGCQSNKPETESSTKVAATAPDACAFPTGAAATPEQTAWELFVAANCPSNGSKVVWENWIEQLQLYPASGVAGAALAPGTPAPKRLHGSPLAQVEARRRRGAALLVPSTNCQPITKLKSIRPPNVTPDATVCEEVHLSPEAQDFITTNGYQIRPGQTAAAKKGTDIEFPEPAVEVKADWIPATDFNPQFSCTQPPAGVYVEEIDGACYALAGMHISSKLLKNWLWATFEPQSMLTNPLRCISFGACNDSWGSSPPTSSGGAGGFTQQTPALTALMQRAKLRSEFLNYRLDGAQIDFTSADGKPTNLGNSVIEGENAGIEGGKASCITCHSISSIKNDGVDGLTDLNGSPVGPKYQVPTDWIARDFVWSMTVACPDNGGFRPGGCSPTAGTMNKRRGK